ncbi:MAG: hypothetical protein DELT_02613 [Desulfovibrio sp.]
MIIPFIPKSSVKPAYDSNDRTRKQAAIFSIFTPTKAPDGTVRYSSAGNAKCFGFTKHHGSPDPWDGGDAA